MHWPTFLIGAGTIAIVVAVRQFNSFCPQRGARFPIPQHLVAVVIMAALVWGLRLDERHGVKIVGPIPAALPHFQLPDLKWDQVRLLAGNAFAIAVLGLLEAVAMAKAIAGRTGQKLDINQQCLSEGAANLAGSFFQCIPGSGSLTRSAVNQQAGAVSQWSGVFSAVAVAVTVLLFAPLAQFIPRAALAGLLMLAAFRMVDRKQLVFHLRATRFDAGVVLATALAAVVVSVEFCIVIGVFLSFVLYVPRAAQVRLTRFTLTPGPGVRERLASDPACDRLLCYHLEGELFFGAEPELEKHFAAIEQAAHGRRAGGHPGPQAGAEPRRRFPAPARGLARPLAAARRGPAPVRGPARACVRRWPAPDWQGGSRPRVAPSPSRKGPASSTLDAVAHAYQPARRSPV